MAPDQSLTTSALGQLVRVGCSGWQYKHWRGDFYPAELPQRQWLEYYSEQFDTVEINNSFYRLPESATFSSWRDRAPAGFTYAVKASRFLTHMKKLKDPEGPVTLFFERARSLGRALGPVLYQLPPRWPVNIERFRAFLQTLPKRRRHVVELREPSWYCDEVFDALRQHKVGLCLHDMAGSASGRIEVGPIVYVRFHGPAKYSGSYSDEALDGWAEWLATRARAGVPVYAYFNNDIGGHAPRDAVRLRDALMKRINNNNQPPSTPSTPRE